jgi:hypothetical protein
MSKSIEEELKKLEATGRITASDHRPVHGDFGFSSLAPSPLKAAAAQQPAAPGPQQEPEPAQPELAVNIDDAWSRLKQTINPS